jgi:peptidoglycan/LPS O-acetylase OafA/YrhL
VKTLLKSTAIGLAAMLGFSSCAYDPYYAGQGSYGTQSAVPAIATGVAIAALAGYANERAARKRAKSYNYAYGGYNPYRYHGGHHGRRHCAY